MGILRHVLVWITNSRAYTYLLIHIIPYIRFTTYYTSFKGYQYHNGYKLLKPGHIILTKDNRKLTTVLIGGIFTHAAFVVGKYGTPSYPNFEVAEMTHTNFTKSHFFDICKESDRVVILECPDFTSEYVNEMVDKCLTFEGATYDTTFEFGISKLYCSELVYQADFKRVLQVDLTDLAGLGREYISPTGLFEAKNVKVVYDSENFKLKPV